MQLCSARECWHASATQASTFSNFILVAGLIGAGCHVKTCYKIESLSFDVAPTKEKFEKPKKAVTVNERSQHSYIGDNNAF